MLQNDRKLRELERIAEGKKPVVREKEKAVGKKVKKIVVVKKKAKDNEKEKESKETPNSSIEVKAEPQEEPTLPVIPVVVPTSVPATSVSTVPPVAFVAEPVLAVPIDCEPIIKSEPPADNSNEKKRKEKPSTDSKTIENEKKRKKGEALEAQK